MSFVIEGPRASAEKGAFCNLMTLWANGREMDKLIKENEEKYGYRFHGLNEWTMSNFNIDINIFVDDVSVFKCSDLQPCPAWQAFMYLDKQWDLDPFIGPRSREENRLQRKLIRNAIASSIGFKKFIGDDKGSRQYIKTLLDQNRTMSSAERETLLKYCGTPETRLYNRHVEELTRIYKESGRYAAQQLMREMGYESADFIATSMNGLDRIVITLDHDKKSNPEHEKVLFVLKFGYIKDR